VTERLLHLAMLNTVMAVFAFRLTLGWAELHSSGNVLAAAYSSLVVLLISVVLGLFAAVLMPLLLRLLRPGGQDSTLAFALAVICLVALTFNLKLSPVVATLTFGLWARHSRVLLNASQRGFGSLGDLFSLLLFVFIASRLDWLQVQAGLPLGLAFVGVRLAAKLLGTGLLAHASGIALRKGLFTGLGTVPSAALVLLLLEQVRLPAALPADLLMPLAAALLLLELCAPLLLQRALVWAREVPGFRQV
jgi:Kef-type K+ transport system membrane component KefB